MFVPGIKNSLHHLNEKDGFEYNYLMQFEERDDALKFAHDWASGKTPLKDRNDGNIIEHVTKEFQE